MSTNVDQRVVEMRFDNKQFQSNVTDTMSLLDKFKQSLNLRGASQGLEEVNAAAKKVDMTGLGGAIEAVQAKFSALQVIGVTALSNLTNSAVNAGKRMISALTIDPIKTGFNEYETKMNAIQTIMANTASKGTTMDDVTRVIDELNTYADKTIYNFSEMTRNIGTFTAAGVGLEESAAAIQGIANLAAVSGSSSQQASTAMYQLSQAMASGTVKLMDWNSVVNAGMGGQVFQDALKETARAHGVSVDAIIKKQGSFRESLSEGWLTADILTETLSKMTKSGAAEYLSKLTGVEQKQIAAAQEIVANNKDGTASYEELASQLAATGKITKDQALSILKMADNAENAATQVKTFTQLWDTLKESAQSGWSKTWEILVGDFEEAKETLTKFSEVIGNIINASAEARNNLLQGWKDAGGRADLVDSLFNVFEGIRSIVVPIKEAFREIFPPITVAQLTNFTKGLKALTERLKLSDTASDNLKRTFKGLFSVLDIVRQIFVAVFNAVKPLFGGLDDLGGGILGVTAYIGDWLTKLSNVTKETNIFAKVLGAIVGVIKTVAKGLKTLFNAVKEKFVSPGLKALTGLLGNVSKRMHDLGDIATAMKNVVVKAFEAIGSVFENLSLVKVLGAVWNLIKTIGLGLGKVIGALVSGFTGAMTNTDFSGILDLLNTISIGSIAVFVTKFVKGFSDIVESVGSFKDSVLGILDSVRGCFEAYQTQLKAGTLMKIASAIAVLVAALLILSTIDSNGLMTSISAITVLFAELMTAMEIVTKLDNGKGLLKTSIAMGKLASSLLVLSIALSIMSTMSWEEMGIGLISMTVGLGALIAAVNLLPDKKVKPAAAAIQKMSSALLVLSVAIKIMSTMSWEEMGIGLITMVAGLAAMVAAVNLLPKDIGVKAISMIALATSLVILAAALKIMGGMTWEEMGIGLISLAGSLLIIAGALYLMTGALPGAAALLIIAPALVIMAAALKIMASMSWEEMAISLVALAGALLILAGGLYLMTGALPGAAALLIIAPALVVLAAALRMMGGMSWEEMGIGLISLAGALLILAGGLYLMTSALPGAFALTVAAAALAILAPILVVLGGMSWEAIGKGLVALAGAFTVLGLAGLILAPVIPSILALAGAIALMGIGMLAAGAGLLAFATGLAALAVSYTAFVANMSVYMSLMKNFISGFIVGVVEGLGLGLITLLNMVGDIAIALGEAVIAIIVAVCDILIECIPPLLKALGVILEALLDFIVSYTPKVVVAALLLIAGLLEGIASSIGKVTNAAANLIISFIRGLTSMQAKLVKAALDMMLDFINGLADGIRKYTPKVIDAVNNLMSAVFEAIGMAIGNLPVMGTQIIQGLIKGITGSMGKLKEAMIGTVKSAWNGVLDFLGIKSPSRLAAEAGMYVDEGLAGGLKAYASTVNKEALGVGEGAMNALSDSISGIADVVNGNMDMQPTIRPVLDLSDVRAGASSISDIFGSGASVGVHANVGAISSSMKGRNANGGTEDVVSAINKLRKDLGNVGNTSYNINGVTYDDGSNITDAVKTIIRAARVERRTN